MCPPVDPYTGGCAAACKLWRTMYDYTLGSLRFDYADDCYGKF